MTLAGVGCAVMAAVGFGSTFVPVRSLPTGDGIFTQLMMCLGAFTVSCLLSLLIEAPQLYPLAMVGGALWCFTNAFAIKLMNYLGMAMAMLIWNTTSCLTGWAIARFGLFGIQMAVPGSTLLNSAGVVLLIIGGTLYLFIKSENDVGNDLEEAKEKSEEAEGERKGVVKRIIFLLCCLVSGTGYGAMTTPITYIQQHPDDFGGAPSSGLPYILSFMCGMMVMSVAVFVVYAIRSEKPYVDACIAAPALLTGAIFGVSMALFFVAIQLLSQTIAYPLCAMLPGLVVSAWSVFYFKEITQKRNIILLCSAYAVTLTGVFLVAASKDSSFP